MDAYEATRTVFSKIQTLDSENASKIMGFLLIQDHGEKEIVRLAFGPESLLRSVILKAKNKLGILSNTSTTTPSMAAAVSLSRQNSSSSSRFNGCCVAVNGGSSLPSPISVINSPSLSINYGSELIDDFPVTENGYSDDGTAMSHRRSFSINDVYLGADDSVSGFAWKPCLYFARGYCKNGSSCRFLHGSSTDLTAMAGSPNNLEMMEQCEELLRSKSFNQQQQQRFAAASQLLSSSSFPYSATKSMNFHMQQQQQSDSQRALSEEMQKLSRLRLMNSMLDMNPASRQIYLTFPADSTFREEDVSNYFSNYGLVQDVRIPYQQKRMFGFVTFVYPDTVKIILAKGNPHFVCDARVLVKPYKEKGKCPEKRQQVDSPTGLDSRMFYNTQDMLLRKKMEEQQAIEMQSRRLMSLQLLDVKKQHHRALSAGGAPIGSPIQSPSFFNQSPIFYSERSSSSGSPPENCSSPAMAFADQLAVNVAAVKAPIVSHENANGTSLDHNLPDSPFASPTKAAGEYLSGDSAEKNTDSGDGLAAISQTTSINKNYITSSLDVASFNSCYFQMPSFSHHGAIGM